MGIVYYCTRCDGEVRPYDLHRDPCWDCLQAEVKRLKVDLRALTDMLAAEYLAANRELSEPMPDWITMARALHEASVKIAAAAAEEEGEK